MWLDGIRRMAIVQTNTPAPAKYNGAFKLTANRCAPINGDTIPKSRPQKLATPAAVPRIGAGKASGVHPYSTALNMLWKKYSNAFNAVLDASVLTAAKRNKETPMRAEDTTIAHFRPIKGTPYMEAPRRTPGTPHM